MSDPDQRSHLPLVTQIVWLAVLGAPVASVAWTVTHEEVLREARDWFGRASRESRAVAARKFFYLFTCEYCFSHYVALAVVWATGFRLLLPDVVGAVLAWFALVWVSNLYMSLHARLRLDITRERVEVAAQERENARQDTFSHRGSSGQAVQR